MHGRRRPDILFAFEQRGRAFSGEATDDAMNDLAILLIEVLGTERNGTTLTFRHEIFAVV